MEGGTIHIIISIALASVKPNELQRSHITVRIPGSSVIIFQIYMLIEIRSFSLSSQEPHVK